MLTMSDEGNLDYTPIPATFYVLPTRPDGKAPHTARSMTDRQRQAVQRLFEEIAADCQFSEVRHFEEWCRPIRHAIESQTGWTRVYFALSPAWSAANSRLAVPDDDRQRLTEATRRGHARIGVLS